MMDFSQMLQPAAAPQPGVAPDAPMPAAGGMNAIMQPQDPIVELMNRPPSSPEEKEQRKVGWQHLYHRLTTDPNLMRAMSMFGVSLAQPRGAGQTMLGHTANAFQVGTTAYDMGKAAQTDQEMRMAKEQRDIQTHGAALESTQASTAGTRASTRQTEARTPGVAADSQVAAGTVEARIREANLKADKAKIDLASATTKEQVDKIELELKQLDAEATKAIPKELRVEAKLANINEALLKVQEARVRIGKGQADIAHTEAVTTNVRGDTAREEITLGVLQRMDDKERKEFLTKTGRYAGHTSAINQHQAMAEGIYDRLPATDPRKANKTRDQFVLDFLTHAKVKDSAEILAKLLASGMDEKDPTIVALKQIVAGDVAARAPNAPAPGAAPKAGEGKWEAVPGTKFRRQQQKDGTWKWETVSEPAGTPARNTVPNG